MPIRNSRLLAVCSLAFLACPALQAQDSSEPTRSQMTPDGREVIDILVPPVDGRIDQRRVEQCESETDASTISGEIIVCRDIVEDNEHYYSGNRDDAQSRYAEETAFAGDLRPPDVAGPGIFRGPATVGSLCIPGLQKCPPPPALMIDITALPEAPPGSDADRIARGLPPIGNDQGNAAARSDALGLPPIPGAETADETIAAESAAPADGQ